MKNIFENLIPKADATTDNATVFEAFVEANDILIGNMEAFETMMQSFTTQSDSIDEIETYVAAINTYGLDKGLAAMGIETGWNGLFAGAEVSLQGFIDGTDTAEAVQEVMMNGVAEILRDAKDRLVKFIKDLWTAVVEFIKGFVDFAVRYKAALDSMKDWDKAKWETINDVKLGLDYDANELVVIMGQISKNAAELVKPGPFTAPKELMLYWMEKNGSYTKTARMSKAKTQTIKECGYESKIKAIHDATVAAVTNVIALRDKIEAISKAKVDAIKAVKEEDEATAKAQIDKIKEDSKLHISAIKATISETKAASSAAMSILKKANNSASATKPAADATKPAAEEK